MMPMVNDDCNHPSADGIGLNFSGEPIWCCGCCTQSFIFVRIGDFDYVVNLSPRLVDAVRELPIIVS